MNTLPEIKTRLEAMCARLLLQASNHEWFERLKSILSDWPTLTEEEVSLIAECRAYCTGIEGLWPSRMLAIIDKHFPEEEKP
jgi:hypothetical protein